MPRKYKVERIGGGVVCAVFGQVTKYSLPHVNLHSPTGFETGYGGSGPADLAVSILTDHFGLRPENVERAWRKSALASEGPVLTILTSYQDFKWCFVSPRQLNVGESYIITADEIDAWLDRKERQ